MPSFRVRPEQSTVRIALRVNLHPSHIDAQGLTGVIDCELDGEGRPDLAQPYAATLTLPVGSITSGNGLQDREMRRRFDASRHPTITATVTHGERMDGDGRYRAAAKLTMHGRTREITANIALHSDGTSLTVDGEHVINVKEFGIDPPRLIVLKVEPEVDVKAHIVAVRQ